MDAAGGSDHAQAWTVGKATRVQEAQDGAAGALDAQLQPHGEGRMLDAAIKHELETETGYRLDNVRIHVGGPTAKLLAEHGKRGAAKGRHILLADGEYAPDTDAGKQLLRHELNHVIQQAHGKVASDLDPQHRAGLEADADRAPAHHGGKELRDLSPPDTGPAQFRPIDGPIRRPPVHHAAPKPARRAPPPRPAPVRRPPVYHAPVRRAPVYHAPVGDDHWNDAKRARTPAHHAPAHHAPAHHAPVHHAPVHHTVNPVGDDHWNDEHRAHHAPAHHAPHHAPAHHAVNPVGDDHFNDEHRARHAPAHHAVNPVGDDHWHDANLRGQHIDALAKRAGERAGADLPIVGPALAAAARAKFVLHLSKRDRADLEAYEHAEDVVRDGIAAVKRHKAAKRKEEEEKEEHHSPFSLHTVTHAGGVALHAAEDAGGAGFHALKHAPETIKDAAVGAYHHPVAAGRLILDSLGADTDDLAEALDDLKHGRIKHLVTQRLKTVAGSLLANPGMPPGLLSRGKDNRQIFDDVVHGDHNAARRHILQSQVHQLITAVTLLPPAKAGKAFAALGALSKLNKLGKAEKLAAAEGKVVEGASHVHPHGKAPHGKAGHEGKHGDGKHGDGEHAEHGEHGDGKHAEHADGKHADGKHGEHADGKHSKGKHDEGKHQDHEPAHEEPHGNDHGPVDEHAAPERSHRKRGSHGGEEVHGPAGAKLREEVSDAVRVLRTATGARTAEQVGREARQKAIRKVLDEHVPGRRSFLETKIAAQEAGRIAEAKAIGELRDLQATMVEKIFDLAGKLGVQIPPGVDQLIPIAIRTGRFFVNPRAIAAVSTDKPRAALRKIIQVLRRQQT